ncbi:hypothetical protein GUITHDRAFT_133709 [Guillardia theta CCMP2712]|uniref:Uncharacterized protein n=1 Tax=Guillardia theta (strain CCMP2712) TaxID=905079 RepID=L1JWT8_GUITC|nr:hypothetical protein GUITHDRAFT_133709 [Guillardia theta CCMP2712]EKX52680.1 hypothetical protein GUITHDRAFT_133709 [Guillardia theta CCMP2712]|eukprot:XP_005839660.1 hypothetical protein GUITHDRAFT_133709 [Guillardia theta CCMP2712]
MLDEKGLPMAGGKKHLFDGQVLAEYMISQGRFENPYNRRMLTREDCLRLDKHCMEIGASRQLHGRISVTEAFDLQQAIKVVRKEPASGQGPGLVVIDDDKDEVDPWERRKQGWTMEETDFPDLIDHSNILADLRDASLEDSDSFVRVAERLAAQVTCIEQAEREAENQEAELEQAAVQASERLRAEEEEKEWEEVEDAIKLKNFLEHKEEEKQKNLEAKRQQEEEARIAQQKAEEEAAALAEMKKMKEKLKKKMKKEREKEKKAAERELREKEQQEISAREKEEQARQKSSVRPHTCTASA